MSFKFLASKGGSCKTECVYLKVKSMCFIFLFPSSTDYKGESIMIVSELCHIARKNKKEKRLDRQVVPQTKKYSL